jgi:heme A synthase
MRVTILLLALAFTVTLGAFTARDLSRHGPTVPGVAGAFVVILLFVALLGALLHPPRR